MPYTLAKFFLWGLLMALAGGVVGWLLRSLKCRGEVARARATTIDEAELERLRGRVANLEPLVAERDRLRMELADVRGSSAGALGFSTTTDTSIIPEPIDDDGSAAMAPTPVDDTNTIAAFADTGATENDAPTGNVVAAADAASADTDVSTDGDASAPSDGGEENSDAAADTDAGSGDAPVEALDLAGAAAVLGKKIKLDDLTVVEGIGPKIAELCNGINVTTWRQLADADVAELQSMLDAAGSRFQMHKPASWPQQAGLLATGQWAEFKSLTDSLTGGK